MFLLFFVFVLMQTKKKKVAFFNETIVDLYQKNVKHILNIFQGFIDIKITKSEKVFQEKFLKPNIKYNKELALLTAFKQNNSRYFEILIIIGLSSAILFFMFNQSNSNALVLLSFFAGASIKIIPSFNKIINSYVDIKANLNCVTILSKYKNLEETRSKKINFHKKINFKNIVFSFDKKKILNNISFEINHGDFIIINGKSGQGKSTFLHTISGLLTANNINIFIDDKLISSSEDYSHLFGYVSQHPFLFQASILENITMFSSKSIDYEFIYKILTALDLLDWINTLPERLNTMLLLESKALSGGQKQRVALARALYFRPKILLLDEATNQLNKSTEYSILKYLKNLTTKKEITVISVSHNKEISAFANKKHTLNNGKLCPNE
ncbi:hypothetical protein BFR04_00635 [Gaetbulibacter sp. 4G1]|nr:hypothetical protein BFR04_00635 [Gaetbulibacter sp. 4G1]